MQNPFFFWVTPYDLAWLGSWSNSRCWDYRFAPPGPATELQICLLTSQPLRASIFSKKLASLGRDSPREASKMAGVSKTVGYRGSVLDRSWDLQMFRFSFASRFSYGDLSPCTSGCPFSEHCLWLPPPSPNKTFLSEQGSMVSHLCLRVNLSHLVSPCRVSSNSPLEEQSCNL